MRSTTAYCLLPVLSLALALGASADDPVFSGPQPGEALAPFQVVGVYGDAAGKEIDPVKVADGKPSLLVFVHKLTRPGIGLTKALTGYAKSQSKAGVTSAIVWLDDDKAKAEQYLNRAAKSLNFVVPVGISVDGGEGPGAYGLNRNVELTILVANEGKVTANFALVQPSVTEAPKIAAELAKLIDQPAPTGEQLQKIAFPGRMARGANMRRRPAEGGDRARPGGELRILMRTLIDAQEPTEVRGAVKELNEWVGTNKNRQAQLGKMAAAVVARGLGTESAKPVLKSWVEQYGEEPETDDPSKADEKSDAESDSKDQS